MAKRCFDPKRVSKALGIKLRQLRMSKGWTLEETEEHGWQSWRHLQTVESGRPITITTLVALANLYGVHPADLLRDT